MWPFKILFLISASLFLTHCNLPGTQKKDNSETSVSSFYVESLNGAYISESFLEEISIPKERTYTFKACLKDLKKSKPVVNHPFYIQEINQEIKTDSSGCLNWTEAIAFEFLSMPTFLKMDRSLTSKGLHTGTEVISFAINPWDIETYKQIIDLSKNKMPSLIEGEAVSAKLKGLNEKNLFDLWVEDGRIFVNEEKLGESVQLKYNLSLQPFIKYKKTSGENSNYILQYGTFNGKIEVILRYHDGDSDSNNYKTVASKDIQQAKMDKGILSFSELMEYSAPLSRGDLFIRLSLNTLKKINNLNGFVGIYPIGDFRSLRNNQFLKVSNSPDVINEINAKIPLTTPNPQGSHSEPLSSSDRDASAKNASNEKQTEADGIITMDVLNITPLNASQHPVFERVRKYKVTACFSNNLISSPVTFQKFKVYGFSTDENKLGDLKEPSQSTQRGCIYWTDSVQYDMYECHHFFKGYVQIENPHFNFKLKRYYYVNPWDWYLIGTDEKEIDNPSVLATSCDKKNPKKSEIILDSVTFTHRGQTNEDKINSNLEMEISRHFNLTLNPKVSVPSDLQEDYNAASSPLANGLYLLRIAVFSNLKTSGKVELIAHKDIPVFNKSGVINTSFDYFVKNKRLLYTNNSVFLQLFPVKQDFYIARNDYTIEPKNPNQNLEDTIDLTTHLLSPVYTQEIPLEDGTKSALLKSFSGSELIKHLGVSYKDENKSFNLSEFVKDFENKKTEEQNKLKITKPSPEQVANASGLTLLTSQSNPDLRFIQALSTSMDNQKISIDETSAGQICDYWFDHFWKDKFSLGEKILKLACQNAAKNNIRSFFDIEYLFIIKNIRESRYLGPGIEKNISLASSFSYSTSVSKSATTQAFLAGKVSASAGKGILNDLVKVGGGIEVRVGGGIEGGGQFSIGTTSSNSSDSSMSLSESTNLKVTESQFKITSDDYQNCITIKPNVALFYKSNKNFLLELWDGDLDYRTYLTSFFKSGISEDEKTKIGTSGILVCQDEKKSKPVTFVEQYFWIEPALSSNEMQDAKDERTRIFSVMVRGLQEYSRLFFLLTNKWTYPASESLEKAQNEKLFNNLLYLNSFKSSTPGVYIYRSL